MKYFPVAILMAIDYLLTACATTGEETHKHCERTDKVAQYEQYCCNGYSSTGSCRGFCTRQSGYVNQCVELKCDEGFIKEKIGKEDLKWWQFSGAFKCVAIN